MTTQHSILRNTSAAKKTSDGSLPLLPMIRHVGRSEKREVTLRVRSSKCHVAHPENGNKRKR